MNSLEQTTIKMNIEQVAYLQKEYAMNKNQELNAGSDTERAIAAALCAQVERLALRLGISSACLRSVVGDNTTCH